MTSKHEAASGIQTPDVTCCTNICLANNNIMMKHHHSLKKQPQPHQKQVKVQKKLNTGESGNGCIICTKTPQIRLVVRIPWLSTLS